MRVILPEVIKRLLVGYGVVSFRRNAHVSYTAYLLTEHVVFATQSVATSRERKANGENKYRLSDVPRDHIATQSRRVRYASQVWVFARGAVA